MMAEATITVEVRYTLAGWAAPFIIRALGAMASIAPRLRRPLARAAASIASRVALVKVRSKGGQWERVRFPFEVA